MGSKSSKNDAELQQEDEFTEEDSPISHNALEQVKECGAIIADGGHIIHCLTIIGQIEGHNVLPPQNKTTSTSILYPSL